MAAKNWNVTATKVFVREFDGIKMDTKYEEMEKSWFLEIKYSSCQLMIKTWSESIDVKLMEHSRMQPTFDFHVSMIFYSNWRQTDFDDMTIFDPKIMNFYMRNPIFKRAK